MLALLAASFAAAVGYVHACVSVTQPVIGGAAQPATVATDRQR